MLDAFDLFAHACAPQHQEIKLLKEKLVDAGPEVLAKILDERDKAESRLRSTKRTVLELESIVTELQRQLQRVAETDIKVNRLSCRSQCFATRSFLSFSVLKLLWDHDYLYRVWFARGREGSSRPALPSQTKARVHHPSNLYLPVALFMAATIYAGYVFPSLQVAEMEYHLLMGSKEAKIVASERDTHVSKHISVHIDWRPSRGSNRLCRLAREHS